MLAASRPSFRSASFTASAVDLAGRNSSWLGRDVFALDADHPPHLLARPLLTRRTSVRRVGCPPAARLRRTCHRIARVGS